MFESAAIERVREFWDRRPCNIRHSPQPIGTRSYFDEVEARKYFVEPHIPRFAEFERWRGRRVLEIGCGLGTDTVNFARHGAQVSAVELSQRSLDLARRRAEVYGLEHRITFHLGNAEELRTFLPVEPYDLVYAFGVIHHAPRPERVVREMRQYLRPGGMAKLMVYHAYSWKVLQIVLQHGWGRWWEAAALVRRYSEAQTGCPITYVYRRRDVRTLLHRCGFRVTEMWVDHIFPYRMPEYVRYRYVKPWYVRLLPAAAFRAIERRLGWHLCVTAEPVGDGAA